MDLSIIVINYNTKSVTADCLLSLKRSQDNLTKEVLVIDNGSTDGSLNYLKKRFPEFKVYSAGGNVGFARGNNFGAKKALGKYLWLLNSDTIVKPDTIQTLFDEVIKHRAMIASCRLLNPDGTIQPQGGYLPTLGRLFNWMFFIDDLPFFRSFLKPYHQNRLAFFKVNQQPGWLAGTALLVEKKTYRRLNGLDNKIFMYGEDVEFCLKAEKLALPVHYFSAPQLTHLGQASGSSERAILGEYSGLKYIYQKHFSAWKLWFLQLFLKIGALLRVIIFGIILQDEKRKAIYLKAYKLA